MTSSITIKPNPFQRSNPFQVQSSYQPSITTSLTGYQSKNTYRPVYQAQLYLQKQNSFSKKPETQIWKFRQDNCGKAKVFSHQTSSILNEKHLTQRNSFQKQLVLGSVGRKNNNNTNGQNVNHNSGQQTIIDKGPIENPFGRKYLITGNTLAESQVYVGFKSSIPTQQNLPTYERFKSQYDVYTPQPQPEPTNLYSYTNYQAPIQDNFIAQIATSVSSNHNLETSLYHKNSQYASRKSIERSDPQPQIGSYHNMSAVESRYSLQKERESRDRYNSLGSNRDTNQPYGGDSGYGGNAYSKTNIPLAERDRDSKVFSRVSVKEQNVKFQQSDDQEQNKGSPQNHRQPTFGSKKDIPALNGPHQITIKGMTFYRQNVVCM